MHRPFNAAAVRLQDFNLAAIVSGQFGRTTPISPELIPASSLAERQCEQARAKQHETGNRHGEETV